MAVISFGGSDKKKALTKRKIDKKTDNIKELGSTIASRKSNMNKAASLGKTGMARNIESGVIAAETRKERQEKKLGKLKKRKGFNVGGMIGPKKKK